MTCDWVGHSTFLSSPHDSAMNRFEPRSSFLRDPVWVLVGAAAGRTCAAREVAPAWLPADSAWAWRRARRCDRVILAIVSSYLVSR